MSDILTVINSGKLDSHLVGDHNTHHTDIRAMNDRKHEMIANLSDIALNSKEADTFILVLLQHPSP